MTPVLTIPIVLAAVLATAGLLVRWSGGRRASSRDRVDRGLRGYLSTVQR